MDRNLLIIGAGVYGLVVKELAESVGGFGRIAFVDDKAKAAADGTPVIATTKELPLLSREYTHAAIAIGNPEVRRELISAVEDCAELQLTTLISPKAYVAPSAQLGAGCIIEPMAVVHTGCVLGKGCLVCAGGVVNHAARCGDCVQVDCNATVAGYVVVPEGSKIAAGTVCG